MFWFQVKLVAEDYESSIQGRNESRVEDESTSCHGEENTELEAGFGVALKETYKHIVTAFDRIGSWNNGEVIAVESLGNITTWKTLFESHIANLQLHVICDAVVNAINYAVSIIFVAVFET